MKALFIINPSSGRQNIRIKLKNIIGQLILEKTCQHVDVFYTEKKDDAKNKASSLSPGEYDFVVAAGGDGTINEVVNGLITSKCEIPMAILSAGTVNDFSSYMELPQHPKSFCRMIQNMHTQKVDVGKVNDQYFINVLAAGMLTDVAYKVPKKSKAAFGKMAYYLECMKELPVQMNQYMSLQFESEEFTAEEDTIVFMVTNTKSVGGFAQAAPLASVTDGYLDVLIARKTNLWLKAPHMFIQILQGQHPNHEDIRYFQTKDLKVFPTETTGKVSVDYDGEILEEGLPLHISIEKAALNLIVPEEVLHLE